MTIFESEAKLTMINQESKEKIVLYKNLVSNEPLIEVNPSVSGINSEAVNIENGSIYYGTGLCTSKELSDALPFDVLGMIFVAEKIRRGMKMKKVYHHIANTHALSNNLFTQDDVDKQTVFMKKTLERIAKNLDLGSFEVLLASEFDDTKDYLDIYHSFETDKHEYVKREVADIEWYSRYKGVNLKLGWIIQSTETSLGNDERVFDREYQQKIKGRVSFAYIKPGRTFDVSRPKVSPYIHIPGEKRLLLAPDQNIRAQLHQIEVDLGGDKQWGGVRRHLTDVVRLYEKLFGSLDSSFSIEDKIQYIIDKVTK